MSVRTIFAGGLFDDKVALITGGGTGIGFRTALELAILGCSVVLCARNEERLEKAVAVINSYISTLPKPSKGKASFVPMNIRSSISRSNCIDKIMKIHKKIDYLVNNAGGQFPTPAGSCSEKGWRAVIDLNLSSLFLLTQEVFQKSFEPQRFGVVVNVIADMWRGFPSMVHTGAARAAVHNLTQTLGVEWAQFGIRVVSVAPGTIDSTGLDSYGPGMKEFLQESKKHNYARRFGTVEEVAASIVFLLSPASAYTTGTTLKVDGGGSLYNPIHSPMHGKEHCIPPFEDFASVHVNMKSNL